MSTLASRVTPRRYRSTSSARRRSGTNRRCDNAYMGKTYEAIDESLAKWLESQPVFFVSTAPLSPDGLVNCSPKGNRREFAVLDEHEVAYLDQTGSGIETIAHLRENGRIVVMFCAFSGPPRILRLHGKGECGPPRRPPVLRPGCPLPRWVGCRR